jgi:hypothetical protein
MTDKPRPRARSWTAKLRKSHEPPPVVARLGWRYHHLGIPTGVRRRGEAHLVEYGLHVSGFPTSSCGIEWMRFDEDSPVHPLIKSLPHLAFEVDDLEAALEGQEVIGEPGSPSKGVRSAMIVVDGAPVELIWFRKPARRDKKKRRGRRRSFSRQGRLAGWGLPAPHGRRRHAES